MSEIVLACHDLSHAFVQGNDRIQILTAVNMTIHRGEQVAIVGASGSGKSTLLQLMAGLEDPEQGSVEVCGQALKQLGPAARGRLRNQCLGFVYQFHHLLPEFSALENVAMPLLLRRMAANEAARLAAEILGRVGLDARLEHRPAQLSGGERQRAAMARALVTTPACVLADEPTGNLDPQTATNVYELMLELNRQLGVSFVVVTHDMDLANRMDRILRLDKGQLVQMNS